MNIETNGNNSATDDVCCSEEVTNFIQIGNITFYINRYSSPDSFPPELGKQNLQWKEILIIAPAKQKRLF